ncbi:MAG: alpha/beta hydrolase [Promethearchaeota archaeon]|nr:MAG: alpha/beta hydrolase [Candidatus Lokiarchaeota archaeon]
MPVYKYDNIEINYIDKGKGEPLVLIQGTNTKLEAWNYQIDYFKEKMRVVAFDNRGAGKSSRPDYAYTIDMYVEDIKSLLNHLDIKKNVHLCGFSMGGMIAIKFILKYPEMIKSLILLATSAHVESSKFKQTFKFYRQFENMTFEEKFQLIIRLIYTNSFKRKLKKNKDLLKKIKNDMNLIVYSEDAPQLRDYLNQWKALEDFDLRNSLNQIKQPTLIAIGAKDLNSSPEKSQELHGKIPNSELRILNNLKHGFIIEAPEAVNQIMWDFIEENLDQ